MSDKHHQDTEKSHTAGIVFCRYICIMQLLWLCRWAQHRLPAVPVCCSVEVLLLSNFQSCHFYCPTPENPKNGDSYEDSWCSLWYARVKRDVDKCWSNIGYMVYFYNVPFASYVFPDYSSCPFYPLNHFPLSPSPSLPRPLMSVRFP